MGDIVCPEGKVSPFELQWQHCCWWRVPRCASQTSSSWLTAHRRRVYRATPLHHFFLREEVSSSHSTETPLLQPTNAGSSREAIPDNASGLALVEADTGRYKTGNTNERRTRLLPLLSLSQFFGVTSWAELWINLRSKYHLPTSPALPAFSEVTNEWLSRPMSTGEANLYLQEMLMGSGWKNSS